MKMSDIMYKVEKSHKTRSWIELQSLGDLFDLFLEKVDYDIEKKERLEAYWLGSWICTTDEVGYRIYFLDDEAVGFSIQRARKSYEEFFWFSEESAMKVYDYLLTLVRKDAYLDCLNIRSADDVEVGDGYSINYVSNIFHMNKATLDGVDVDIVSKSEETGTVVVRKPSGEELTVGMKSLLFKYYLSDTWK